MTTQTVSSSRMARPLALLLALALGASSCSDSDDVESGLSGSSSPTTLAESTLSAEGQGLDLQRSATTDGDRSGAESADAMAEAEALVGAEDAGGGFFSQVPVAGADERLEDNTFRDYGVRSFIETAVDPLSTFALDVDTASYSIGRRWLEEGILPPPESVRVEEYINSFSYDYPDPADGLTVVADGGPSPFNEENIIVRLGVQAEQVRNSERPPASLTFVIDTSGSMDRDDRLGLVKTALERLVIELDSDDQVSIVTYSDTAEIILPPTSVANDDEILEAIDRLGPGGSTNLEAGLRAGYDLADDAFQQDGINRVILASDGVANVGLTDPDGLVELIRDDADRGIQLVTMGVGMGNFNDVVMETLADDGDGFYAYVNDVAEAEQLFSDDLVSTLLTVAIDGKIQVEFDEETVAAYRLIGFENRAVLDDDFRNDAVDAGELGAGHQVTALYELELHPDVRTRDRLGTAQLRWEDPESGSVMETRLELTAGIVDDRWTDTDDDFRLAVTVAAYAEILRGSQYAGEVTLQQIAEEAEALSGSSGSIAELAQLVNLARDFS